MTPLEEFTVTGLLVTTFSERATATFTKWVTTTRSGQGTTHSLEGAGHLRRVFGTGHFDVARAVDANPIPLVGEREDAIVVAASKEGIEGVGIDRVVEWWHFEW